MHLVQDNNIYLPLIVDSGYSEFFKTKTSQSLKLNINIDQCVVQKIGQMPTGKKRRMQ